MRPVDKDLGKRNDSSTAEGRVAARKARIVQIDLRIDMAKHKAQTDQTHQVTLPSSIERVEWDRLRASPGGTVGLAVSTRYVGNGSTLQITLRDRNGATHGTFRDPIHHNRLTAEVQVPRQATGALFATVRLPNHGLKQESPALVLSGPVAVRRPTWSQEAARQGDVLTLSADIVGAPDGAEAQIRIFEHSERGAHDPVTRLSTLVENGRVTADWEYEYTGDVENIPTEQEADKGYKPPEYFFRVEVEGVTKDSDLLPFKDWIELTLKTHTGQEEYVLHLPDGSERRGQFADDGTAREEDIPPGPVEIDIEE